MPKFIRNCDWCQQEFETEWETKTYCTRQHKENARMYRKRFREGRVRPVRIFPCPVCKVEVTSTNKQKLYCSTQCKDWLKDQRRREIEKNKWQASNTPLLKARIFYRDKGLCQLCHQPIDLTLEYPNPMMFSIDHIVPRSKGGNHTIGNLQASHLICNTRRGNNALEQA